MVAMQSQVHPGMAAVDFGPFLTEAAECSVQAHALLQLANGSEMGWGCTACLRLAVIDDLWRELLAPFDQLLQRHKVITEQRSLCPSASYTHVVL